MAPTTLYFCEQCCDSSTRQFQFCVYSHSLSATLGSFLKTRILLLDLVLKQTDKVRLIVSLNFNKTTCEESEVSFNPKRRSRTFYKNKPMLMLHKAHDFHLLYLFVL